MYIVIKGDTLVRMWYNYISNIYKIIYIYIRVRLEWDVLAKPNLKKKSEIWIQNFGNNDTLYIIYWQLWARVAKIKFQQVQSVSTSVDIQIKFVRGEHGDPYPFLNGTNKIAHAFFPAFGSDQHYNEEKEWSHMTFAGRS